MLDGTSVEEGTGHLKDKTEVSDAAVRAVAAQPDEPRREIWFKRKISVVASLHELWTFRELVVTLAERDLRVRYKQAVLGIAWALITPVAMMIAFTLLFTKVTTLKTDTMGAPYALFSYVGLVPWTFFATALQTGGMSLVGNVPLLNKLYCPREVFPIAAMIDAAFDAFIASLVLVLLFPILGFAPHWQVIIYTPLLLFVMLLFTLGVTAATSVIVVYVRDLRLVLPIVIQLGLFATPVIYSTPQSVLNSPPALVAYSALNPLVPVLDGFRLGIFQGQPPNWLSLGAGAAGALIYFLLGFVLFKRLETGIADVA